MKTFIVLFAMAVSSFAHAETCEVSFAAKQGTYLYKRDASVEYGKGVGIDNQYGYVLNETRVSPDTYIEHVDVFRIDGKQPVELKCSSGYVRNDKDAVVAVKSVCPVGEETTLTVKCSIYGLPLEQ